jgi:hypothetical protein
LIASAATGVRLARSDSLLNGGMRGPGRCLDGPIGRMTLF